jgi:uncharacterized membrane protein
MMFSVCGTPGREESPDLTHPLPRGRLVLWQMLRIGTYGVGFVMLIAGCLKLTHPQAFREGLADYRLVPRPLLSLTAFAIPAIEVAGGIATAVPATHDVGVAIVIALLCAFSAAVLSALARGYRQIRCACLGARSHVISGAIPARNGAVCVLLILDLVGPGHVESTPPVPVWCSVALVVAIGIVLLEAARVALTIRGGRRVI